MVMVKCEINWSMWVVGGDHGGFWKERMLNGYEMEHSKF